ncbi:hypothetical protein A33M_4395 [Rhodovulum sp. PH10]|uniref:hypothetical protein n=1 Tax=Rhodovulum sp. PH10 TaxID=1187851 RepID=UPI00027C2E33|nr:hypothetical protein [Rhodovulum sp. PH10]EJW10484.1 hypothetical protein A33M_4395 [Rhodovulum sp. PH10]
MKTTLTLDDDVAAALERVRTERGTTLDQAANDALRHGLARMGGSPERAGSFETRSVSLGRALIDVSNVHDAIAAAEGDAAT